MVAIINWSSVIEFPCLHDFDSIFVLVLNHYINVREYRRGNHKWTIQRNWQHIRCYLFHLTNQIRVLTSSFYFIMILLSIYIYNWIGNKFLQLTSPSPYKYINSINKTHQMTANVQAISIIISKLSKIMSN